MLTLEDYLTAFVGSLTAHAALAVYLFVMMDVRGWRILKRLPALLLSPLLASLLQVGLHVLIPDHVLVRYYISSFAVLLMCTFWARWSWRTEFWRAFSAVCMGGVFQVSTSCLSQILLLNSELQFTVVVYLVVVPISALLLHRLHFGHWFRFLLEEGFGQHRTALFLFALEAAMETFLILQAGIQPEYLVPYFMLVLAMAALEAGLVIHLAKRLDTARKAAAQQDVIAQQQFYERDLEAIRQEVRAFRHDYKNLLAGLSEQADEGELDQLRAALSELDTGFDRRIGEKIQASTQIGNVRVPPGAQPPAVQAGRYGKAGYQLPPGGTLPCGEDWHGPMGLYPLSGHPAGQRCRGRFGNGYALGRDYPAASKGQAVPSDFQPLRWDYRPG